MFCLALAAGIAFADAQGTIVQDGNFSPPFGAWSGDIVGYTGADPDVPNGFCALASDIYQDIPTTPGDLYSVSFEASSFATGASMVALMQGLSLKIAPVSSPFRRTDSLARCSHFHPPGASGFCQRLPCPTLQQPNDQPLSTGQRGKSLPKKPSKVNGHHKFCLTND
jgi:hypothetical protein